MVVQTINPPTMNAITVSGELNFHEQEVLSIFHETNASGRDEKFAELAFAGAFAIRSMSNLGVHDLTDVLGQQLQLIAKLVDESPGKMLEPSPRIVEYPGYAGRKRFVASLRLNAARMQLDYAAKGFGFLARGVGYYVPVGVTSLFRYFASRRAEDVMYRSAMARVAADCGQLQLQRQIQLTNHSQLVRMLAMNSMTEFVPDWML